MDLNKQEALELLDDLNDEIDELSEVTGPILKSSVMEVASKLSVIDKTKFYVMISYTLESIIFSYLKLNSVETKEHPIMQELERIRRYVQKIKKAQEAQSRENISAGQGAAGPSTSEQSPVGSGSKETQQRTTVELQSETAASVQNLIDGVTKAQEAGQRARNSHRGGRGQVASRFIKHSLSGNDRYDREKAEREEKSRQSLMSNTVTHDLEIKEKRTAGVRAPRQDDFEEGEVLKMYDDAGPSKGKGKAVQPQVDMPADRQENVVNATGARIPETTRGLDGSPVAKRNRGKRRRKAAKGNKEQKPKVFGEMVEKGKTGVHTGKPGNEKIKTEQQTGL